jgi:hypothetical protein
MKRSATHALPQLAEAENGALTDSSSPQHLMHASSNGSLHRAPQPGMRFCIVPVHAAYERVSSSGAVSSPHVIMPGHTSEHAFPAAKVLPVKL